MLYTVALCVLAYLIGSLSPAVIICRLAGISDPRFAGSKNPGTTNVLRLGGKRLAALTLVCDMLKGFLPVILAMYFTSDSIILGSVAVAVFLGHLYPVFYHFRGGKGVATAIGALLALSWPAGLCCIAVWLLMAFIFKISSLAALISAVLAPFCVAYFEDSKRGMVLAGFVGIMSVLIVWRHKANIQRLMKGVEPKMGAS